MPANEQRKRLSERYDRNKREWLSFVRQLEDLDPNLSLVYVNEKEHLPGCIPGRFHIARDNGPGLPPFYYPILTPEGGYKEPDSSDIEWMKSNDLQNRRVDQDKTRGHEKVVQNREKARQLAHEQRTDELVSNINALSRVSVVIEK